MSYSTHYGPVDPFSPLDNDQGPRGRGAYSQPPPWSPDDMEADLGSPGIEMRNTRPGMQDSRFSGPSLHSSPSEATLFPKPGEVPNESHSFLHDPLNHLDTGIEDRNSPPTHIPYKDNTGRQLRHLLLGSSVRFGITLGLCAAYILTVRLYMKRGIMDENAKKFCNAYTTAISIALGLNIASAFKDMALNMRWPILASRKRNLIELDLLLNCDSLTKLAELALVSRRPLVIFICLGWLFINLLAQAGIAMLSLTYGFEDDTTAVLLTHGNVTIPMMDHFYPWGNNDNPTRQDEEYIAHMYGGLGYNYGMNETQYMPKAGSIYVSDNAMLWYDYPANRMEFIFSDTSSPSSSHGTWSIYTNRTINITYACDVYEVTANGNGTSNNITVKDLGDIFVSHTIPESISFFTNGNNYCDDKNPRCSVVEAFEASETDPWYYKCNITLGQTVNDPHNYSQINDNMAFWATSSIAFVDSTGQEAQIYPQNSLWGEPLHGNSSLMGNTIATFALGAIAGATLFNPSTIYVGMQPSGGFALQQNHPYFFYLILGLICICQLIFVTIVAIFANRVMVGPEGHLSMSMLLRPIADALFGVSGGKENQMFKNAKKYTLVKYEKGRGDRWQLAMTDTSRMT